MTTRLLTDTEIEQVFGGECTGLFTCTTVTVCHPNPIPGGPELCTQQTTCQSGGKPCS